MFEDKIPVHIMGQTYEILGNASEALYYTSLARYVEDKMKEIQKGSNIISSQKIAVLAALNIADELFKDREKKNFSGKSIDKRFEEMIKVLDQVLEKNAEKEEQKKSSTDSQDLFLS